MHTSQPVFLISWKCASAVSASGRLYIRSEPVSWHHADQQLSDSLKYCENCWKWKTSVSDQTLTMQWRRRNKLFRNLHTLNWVFALLCPQWRSGPLVRPLPSGDGLPKLAGGALYWRHDETILHQRLQVAGAAGRSVCSCTRVLHSYSNTAASCIFFSHPSDSFHSRIFRGVSILKYNPITILKE